MHNRTLVVLEHGSRWPAWFDEQDPDSVELIAQQPSESSLEFARRTVDRIARLEVAPLTSTLVCSADSTEEHNRLRASLLRALVNRAEDAGRGHVVLVADGGYGQQRALAELAATVNEEIAHLGKVSLRFRALARPRPGVVADRQVA